MFRRHVRKNHTGPLPVVDKDPDSVIWLEIVWDAYLGSDTISSVSNEINHQDDLSRGDDLSVDSTSNDQSIGNFSHVNRIKLSGGFAGTRQSVTNRIVTSAGETVDATVPVWIGEK